MSIFETLSLAFKAILANRLRSALTVLGIVIGVTSVILLVSLVTGLQTYITGQISGLGSNLIFVIPGRLGGARSPGGIQVNRLTLQYANEIKTALGTSAEVAGAVQKITTVKKSSKTDKGASIFGVPANITRVIQAIKIAEGRFFTTSEADSGKRVAFIGPTVKLNLFGEQSPINQYIEINNLKYQVIGVFTPRGSTFGADMDNTIYAPLLTVQRQFGIDKLNTIYVSVKDAEMVKPVQEKVISILGKRLSEDDFTVQTQEQTLATISQITGVLTLALGGIAAISLIVGGIGVMNIMLVSVTERTREIGLRKALGARPQDIRNQFLIEAITLSGIGGIVGIILGFLLSLAAQAFLTTSVPLWSVGLSFGFSMLVGVVFGVAPAIRAARLNPIQALRYE